MSVIISFLKSTTGNGQPDTFTRERRVMVEQQLRGRGIHDERLLAAMAHVARNRFVPLEYLVHAYADYPIPIGEGQTISQPYIVAVMLQLLELQPEHLVLEIGTGSGYQTAIIAELSRHVFGIERHASLAERASSTLEELGYRNATILIGDGSQGFAALAPFDRIVVSAAVPRVPNELFEQLREGGRMVLPVGGAENQELQLIGKKNGALVVTRREACRFVPLVGAAGFRSAG